MLNSLRFGFVLVAMTAISACGEKTAPKKDLKKQTALSTSSPIVLQSTINRQSLSFNGQQEDAIQVDSQPADYILDMELKNLDSGSRSYSDFLPPMPMRSDGLAIYHLPDQYRFIITHNDKTTSEVFANLDQIIKLRFANVGGSAMLRINNETVWTGDRAKPLSFVNLGKGHRDRFWKGEVTSVKLCDVEDAMDIAEIETATCE